MHSDRTAVILGNWTLSNRVGAEKARRMRDMLKCEISMILVSEYTRGDATGRSSSCATAHSARTNSTIASLSRRSLRARTRISCA